MSDQSYVPFSLEEGKTGAIYALEHYGFKFDANWLSDLATRVREHMGSAFLNFSAARSQVLNGACIYARTSAKQRERKAIEGALGKMFNLRRQYARRNGIKKKSEKVSRKYPINPKGQLEFVLSSRRSHEQ